MTVPSATNRSGPYNGNGVTTVFDYEFKITNENYIKVIKADAAGVETVLTIDADYVVSDVGNPAGGQVALTVPLPTGQTLTMIPNVPFTQEIDLENQGAYYAETVEAGLDLATMRDQQLQEQISRAVTIPASEDPAQLDGLIGDILRLADSADNLDIVANNIADVNEAADNMAAIIAAPAQAAAAAASATAADTSEDFARKWATEAEDVAVNDGVNPAGFSAFHWMRKALGYATSASASAIAAAASAASIALPAIVASTFLQAKADASGYETKTPTEVRNALAAAVFVANRAAVKALDPTKDRAATTYGEGLGLNGTWVSYLTSSLSAVDQAAAAIDTTEAIYLTSGSYTWVRHRVQIGKINVKWCGAKGDNLTNDTAPIVAALALAGQLGAPVYAPAGTYRVNAAVALASGASVYGDGPTLTIFRTTSATANVFTINGISCGLYDLRIDASVVRSAGWYVDIAGAGANFRMNNFTMGAPFEAFRIADVVGDVLVSNGRIDDTVATTGRTIRVGTGTGTGPVVIVFSNVNCIASTGARPLAHVSLFNCGDISLIGCQFIAATYNMEVAPAAGQGVYSIKSTNSYYDQAGTTNVRIVPTSTGVVKRGVFVNNWISSAGTHNVDIEPGSTATVDGLTFSCNEVFGGTYGYYMTGISGNLTGINISNEMIAGSSSAGIAMDTVTKAQITNNVIGNVGGFGGVATGISTFGAMSKVEIVNNNLDGATTKINIAGATFSGGSRIEGNLGYNPVGAVAAAAAGASPFTYTAGPSPETVYFKQTATNTATITQGGQQIATLANASTYYPVDLGPNESVVVTWATTAPTYTRMIH
ncbi:MAG: hypothetical protein EOQ34_05205 [Mesorhizobium sp.]|nr:glycosyl hydrolase family 28-related protein [Mesorhizobium sp.]RWF74526.1 MAG: hypothetical protein EOQ34_05205 [Mesorhizobium sp.]